MTWWGTAPAVLVAVALLVGPGLVVTSLAGVRGVSRLALAPPVSVGLLALTAVAAQLVGARWSWPVVLVGTGTVALLAAGWRKATSRWWAQGPAVGDPPGAWAAASVGALAGGASLVVGFVRGAGDVRRWPQTFDAVFHLSAAWHVLTSGDGSSLTLGTLTAPGAAHGFYPAAWHDLAALVAGLGGVPVVVAANALSVGVLGVAWPLGVVGLVRVAVGPRPVALAAGGALAAGVTASPVVLGSYGTLWPNQLGTALLPGALALLAIVLGGGVRAPASRVPASGLLGLAAAGLVLAHPNTAVSLLVLGVAVGVVLAWPRGGMRRVVAVGLVPATAWVVGWSPVFAATRSTSWPARESVAQALGEWLLLSPQRLPIPLVVAGLTLVGAVAAWRGRSLRWLVVAHATGGALFTVVAGSDAPLARLVSGPWYDDAFRLAALAGVTAVPLAAVAVDLGVRRAVSALRQRRGPSRGATAVVAAVALGGVALATNGLSWADTRTVTGWWYRYESILGPQETALLEGLPRRVPADGVVAGNPFDGAAESGAVGGREPLFPHLVGRWDPDRVLLAGHLDEASGRPDVCAAVRRLHVTHVLTGEARFWAEDPRRVQYAGLDVRGAPGFEVVARAGGTTLWRVTACG